MASPSEVTTISIYSNSFQITRLPVITYWQYDVFIPQVNIARKRQLLLHHLQTVVSPEIFNPRPLYDGNALLYSSKQLRLPGGKSGRFCISLGKNQEVPPSTKGAFEIILNMTAGGVIEPSLLYSYVMGNKSLPPAAAAVATNVLQLIIKQMPNQNFAQNARAFFVGHGKKQIQGTGLEIWQGFYQSVRPATKRMIINVDTTATIIYKSGNLLGLCMEFLDSRNIRDLRLRTNEPKFRDLQKHLQNLRIEVKTIRGTKVIRELQPAVGQYRFTLDDGRETTVEEYYQRTHGIRLNHPDIIGVQISGKNAPHPVLIPLELCEVVSGQFYKKTLSPQLRSKMVSHTALHPDERLKKIADTENAQSPVRMYTHSEFIKESGLEVDPNPISITAKLLSPPVILTRDDKAIKPTMGCWAMLGNKVIISEEVQHWAAVNFDNSKNINEFQAAFSSLQVACRSLGIQGRFEKTSWRDGNPNDVEEALKCVLRDTEMRLNLERNEGLPARKFIIFAILPDGAGTIQNRIKFWGDCIAGVMTLCLNASNLRNASNSRKAKGLQYMNLVALKLNARLGGINSYANSRAMVELQKTPFMFVGADVSHPGPQTRAPSITALVWSYDMYGTRYACRQRIQRPRQEIIKHLREMIIEALCHFMSIVGEMPRKIIFLRDGVSEGEYAQVQNEEIRAIHDAFTSILQDPPSLIPPNKVYLIKKQWGAGGDTFPKLVYVVVGKRHHNSFFPDSSDRRYQADNSGNCPPGTLVDDVITQPTIRDFFLQSHAGIKGTSRSAHYVILQDEVFGPQNVWKLQQICYSLCHVYANCTRSISIPAPVYYANKACTTAATHFDPDDNVLQYGFTDNANGPSETPFNLADWERAFKRVNHRLRNEMHFT